MAHNENILTFVTQAKSNRLDLWFDSLTLAEQERLIRLAKKKRDVVKKATRKELSDFKKAKLTKKQQESQSQQATDIARSQRRR